MPTDPPQDPTVAAAEETAPPATPGPDLASRLAAAEQELTREREHRAALEGTLRVLAPTAAASGPPALVRLPPDSARRIAQTLGGEWNEGQVQAHAPIFAAFLQELAAPILQGIEGMADAVDLVQARQEVPQYETQAEEADRVRAEYRQRGQVITRKQAVALVKARRMDDPRYMDELVDKRAAARAAEQADRGAAAAAAVTAGGAAAEKVGPAPTKGSRQPLTKEEFARLSLEEKRKALADVTI
jgi:hypothetical protein